MRDTSDVVKDSPYYDKKNQTKEVVNEPYFDAITDALRGVLIVSTTTPLLIDGQFSGIMGVDLDMKKFQETVKKIKPYEESASYLISLGNIVVGHTNEEYYGKNFLELRPGFKTEYTNAIQQIKKGNAHSFIYENEQDEEIYVSIFPIIIGNDKETWALATETPISKVLEKSNSMFIYTIVIGLIGLAILYTIIYFILKSVTKRLLLAVNHSQKISEGDLTIKLDIEGKNEIGVLAVSLNKMADKLKDIISNVTNSSKTINSASSEITNVSSELSQSSSNQAASIEEVMASVEEMTSNIHNNSDNAKETETIAEKALKGVENGSNSANKTVISINKIADKINIIQEISHQTNILPLNAAVEAARAGDHGKGFAVVANEVKKLAEKAQVAATEINELSANGVQISDLAEKELSALLPDIEKTTQLVKEIANANLEQSHGATEIQNVIQQLNDIAQKNAAVSDSLNLKAQNLTNESKQLEEAIRIFKI